MELISSQMSTSALKGSFEIQEMAGSLVTSTIDRLNSGRVGMTPVVNSDYMMQKSVLSAAYSAQGIGTKLDIMI